MIGFSRLSSALAWLAALLLVASGFMLSYEVVARYFFTRPTIWAAEISQLCLIWGVLLGMPWLLANKQHIHITAVTNLLSPQIRYWLEVLQLIIISCFSAIVVWFGSGIFFDSFERGRTTGSLLDLPAWIAELAVPFGFTLLLLEALVQLLKLSSHPKKGNSP